MEKLVFTVEEEILQTKVNPSSVEFKENTAYHLSLEEEFLRRQELVLKGGEEKYIKLHEERNKLTARERIQKLIDKDSSFLELSSLAAFDKYENEVPSAGIITGIGKVCGVHTMIIANDATVKGGTYFPITVKKHLRAQEIAKKNYLPCIYLVDSGGAFLPMQEDVFPDRDHFGRIFYNEARMSALGIAQIAVVMGLCTAGGAYIPAMADQSVIVKGTGTIFLGGPPLVKAATGEDVTSEELGGAEVHCKISGVADYFAENDESALQITRSIVGNLNIKKRNDLSSLSSLSEDPPLYPIEELYGVFPRSLRRVYDVSEVIARIVDGSRFSEFKKLYGTTIRCGFARIAKKMVGIIANQGVLFSESALKATHFIQICGMRGIPLLFLQNISGFMVGKKVEHQGIAKDGAKLVMAVSNVEVPKFTLIIGGSYGAGNYGMCGRAYDPTFLWMLPHSKIAVMGGEQASKVLLRIKKDKGRSEDEEEMQKLKKDITSHYEHISSAYYSTSCLWDDGIIAIRDIRKILAFALAVSANAPQKDSRYGIFRM